MKIEEIFKAINEIGHCENSKWTRAYFAAILRKKIVPMDLINEKIIQEWKTKNDRRAASDLTKKMRKKGFLKKVDNYYYKPNKDIIKSIVKYFAFSDNEARILEKLLCNPTKQPYDSETKIKQILIDLKHKKEKKYELPKNKESFLKYCEEIDEIVPTYFFPSEPRERWRHDLEEQIKSNKIYFINMFYIPGDFNNIIPFKYINLNSDDWLKGHFQNKNSLSTLIRYVVGARIDEMENSKNYPDDQGFEIKRIIFFDNIFTHLMLYPYMKQNNFVIPNVIKENNHSFVQFDFKDFDIIETWKIMIKYITKYKRNHFAFDFIGDWLKEEKNQVGLPKYSMKKMIDNQIASLAKNKYLIICNYPFTIKMSGNKTLLIKKLEELREYIIKNRNKKI